MLSALNPLAKVKGDPGGRAAHLIAFPVEEGVAALEADNKDIHNLEIETEDRLPVEETDRAPVKSEVEACMPFLEKQIELIRPRVIVLLGGVAVKWFDPSRSDIKMEDEAGRFFELMGFPGIQCVVLYNPAFLLRDPRKKQPTWEHLKALRSFLSSS